MPLLLTAVPAFAQSSDRANDGAGQSPAAAGNDAQLPVVSVKANAAPVPATEATYGGGQIAKGAPVGVLGAQELINVPFSMTSYTEKAIKDKQAKTVGEFIQESDPNVRVAMGLGQFADYFTIRGFVLYSDDVALNGLYGLTPRQMVATDAVSRIDIFKGTSAFLNGAAAGGSGVGGAVNIELKRADDKPLTEVTAAVSGSGELGAHVDVGRRFGDQDQFGIRFNQSDSGGETSIDSEKRYNKTTALSLDWRGDKLKLTADFLYQRMKIDQGRTTYTATGSIPAPPAATSTFAQPWTDANLEDTVGILGAEYEFAPNWTAYVSGGMRHGNERATYSNPAYDGATGTATAYRFSDVLKEDATSANAGIRGKFNTGPVSHQVNVGASIVSIEQDSAYTMGYGAFTTTLSNAAAVPYPATTIAAGDMGNPGKTEQIINKGVSISDTLGFLNDRVLFTIGVRRQSISVDAYDYTGVQSSTYDQSITTPIFGIVFKPLDNLAIYANRSEALQQGTTAGSGTTNFGQVFAPYRSKQYEAGVKYDLGKFGANAAVFQITKPNAYTDPTTLVYSQSGEQRNRGVEVGLYGEPLKGLRLIAGASYTDAKITQTSIASEVGNTAVGVPHFLANIGAEYDIRQVRGLTLTGQWIYTSRQFLDEANTLSIGSWSRFDVGARYKTNVFHRDVTVRGTVHNAFNRAYWASAYGGYLTLGNPRTFWLSLTTDF